MNQPLHPCVVLTGFHRSGTSLVAQKLHRGGVYMGQQMLASDESNPDGHYEDHEFLRFHERALRCSGVDWLVDAAFLRQFDAEQLASITTTITRRRLLKKAWGFKDPRVCLYLPFWRRLLPEAVYLVVLRQPDEIVRSLIQRAYTVWRQSGAPQNPNVRMINDLVLPYRCWLQYMETVLHFIGQQQSIVLHLGDALTDATLQQCLSPYNINLQATDHLIEQRADRLQRRRPEIELPAPLRDRVDSTYRKLASHAYSDPPNE